MRGTELRRVTSFLIVAVLSTIAVQEVAAQFYQCLLIVPPICYPIGSPPLLPSPPTVSAAGLTSVSVSVSWSEPLSFGWAWPISDYDVRYRQGSIGSFTSHSFIGTGTSTTISGLLPGAAQLRGAGTGDEYSSGAVRGRSLGRGGPIRWR